MLLIPVTPVTFRVRMRIMVNKLVNPLRMPRRGVPRCAVLASVPQAPTAVDSR